MQYLTSLLLRESSICYNVYLIDSLEHSNCLYFPTVTVSNNIIFHPNLSSANSRFNLKEFEINITGIWSLNPSTDLASLNMNFV